MRNRLGPIVRLNHAFQIGFPANIYGPVTKRHSLSPEPVMTASASNRSFDCMIVGAGHTGLLLARLLADHGLRVALLDRRADPQTATEKAERPAGWGLSVNLGGVIALRTAGLWQYLSAHSQPLSRMRVADATSNRDVLYEAAETGSEALSWGIGGQDLEQGLQRSILDQPTIEGFWGQELTGHHFGESECTLTCRSGLELTGQLVVAADGRKSPLRRAAALDGLVMDFKQTALTVGVTSEESHRGEGFEVLLPGGPLAFLPLPEGRPGKPSASLTWVLPRDKAAHWQKAKPEAVAEELGRHMPKHLGRVRVATPIAAFPLNFSHARRLIGRRLALVGDAAHGLHPIHAQGFNLALRDVARLAELLVAGRRLGQDPGAGFLLRRYEASRLPDSLATGLFTTGFSLLSSSAHPLARSAINATGYLLQKVRFLRHSMMRQGRGEFPCRPRLLRGLPL